MACAHAACLVHDEPHASWQVRDEELEVCRQLQQQLLQELPDLQAENEQDIRLQGKLRLLACLLNPAHHVCPIARADTCHLIQLLLTGRLPLVHKYQ